MIKKLIAAALLISCVLSFTGCGSAVMAYGDTKLSAGMYQYMFASMKQDYLDSYSDVEDTAEFWSKTAVNDLTYAEFIDTEIRTAIREFVIASALFDARGYKVDDEGEEQIEQVYQKAVAFFGSEKALSAALSKMGLTADQLRQVYTIQYKYERMLYDSGIAEVTDEVREEYYRDRYALLKVIYIPTANGYSRDEKGEKLIGSDGMYVMYPMTDAERAQKQASADALEQSLNADAAYFDTAYTDAQINELDVSLYPHGMYICADDLYASGLTAVAQTAFSLEIGAHARVSDENGIYFVRRVELIEHAYEDDNDYIWFSGMDEFCSRYQFSKIIDERSSALTEDEDKIASYSVTDVAAVAY